MVKITEKQKRFADEYIRTGNVSASYRVAYPNVKKENSASAAGSRLLKNVNVKSYIDKRLVELKKATIAEQDEILQFLTSVMRGEMTEQIPVGIGEGAQQLEDKDTFLKDRVKAAELLGKRYIMWTDKQQIDGNLGLSIEVDYGDGDDNNIEKES
ncbi:terminase small subunit [Bacillus sp. CRN 9]|nr:terminase small subunit [Bacillus sp. CRN 9]